MRNAKLEGAKIKHLAASALVMSTPSPSVCPIMQLKPSYRIAGAAVMIILRLCSILDQCSTAELNAGILKYQACILAVFLSSLLSP